MAAAALDAVFGLALAVATAGEPPSAAPDAPDASDAPVVDEAWLAAQALEANRLFGPMGVRFRRVREASLPDASASLHTRADRDALGALPGLAAPGMIRVFVVRALEDVDEPGRMRMGVCWTHPRTKERYVVLSRIAKPGVLAHELGHLFGNPHSEVLNNVMSYTRDGGVTFFDVPQQRRIASFAGRFLGEGTFRDVGRATP